MELQNMRRTHYSSDLSSQDDGKSVIIMGWILTVRSHGNICFATVRDRDGDISIVAKKGDCSDSIRETLSGLKPHSSVGITGIIKASAKAPSGFEIIPTELRVFSKVEKIPPFSPMDKIVKNIETRLKVRSIDLRRAVLQNVFKLRSEILYDIRKYFHTEKFMEISTPKIISSSTEGGSSLFAIFYYNKEAFLAQSPQLYKEQLTMSFERVFEIGPIFRAEASRTNRHLAEAISIDLEEAFVDYNDIMTHIDNIIRSAVTTATVFNSEHKADFKIPAIPDKIPRHTYKELLERMQAAGVKCQYGDDLYPTNLEKIGMTGFYFITNWPIGPKPFYVKMSEKDPEISESFDLMYNTLELSSGSTRSSSRKDIMEKLKMKNMDSDSFEYHLSAFDYGMPPHAGCGIGLERLMMAITGIENIRDATFYPRDVDRLSP